MDDATHITRFQALLAGHKRIFGTYNNIVVERGDGKITGKPSTQFTGVTAALYVDHLAGKNGLGIAPIRDDNTCVFGAIDIDVYVDLDHTVLALGLKTMDLPLVPCRSKSGGCHLYLFANTPVAASLMQARLRDIAAHIGHGKAEVFPKQTTLDPANLQAGASWINLPYFDADKGNRYAITTTGAPMTLAQFLDHAEASRVGPEFFQPGGSAPQAKAGKPAVAAPKDPLPDGPPCLNHLIQIGFPVGTQDNGMMNLGIYTRKAHPSNWRAVLEDFNARHFTPPLAPGDLLRITNSLGKNEYKYQCQQTPLKDYCNSQVCRRRKYGVGDGTEVVTFGSLSKLLTEPPVWYWHVEVGEKQGVLELATAELQDPNAVQRKCMERMTFAPAMPKRNDWIQTLQLALKGCTDLAPLPEDASTEGQFFELLERFLTGQVQAFTLDEILMGKPYTADGRHYFRLSDLGAFLSRSGFKEYKTPSIAKVLRSREVRYEIRHEEKNLKGKFTNLWTLKAFPRQTEGHTIPESIQKDDTIF